MQKSFGTPSAGKLFFSRFQPAPVISLSAKGQNGPKSPYFAIYPKSAPSTRKLRFSVFRPEFLCAKGRPRSNGLNPQYPVVRNFPPAEVRSARTQNVKRLRNFEGKLSGRPDFCPKVPLAPGNCVFLLSARNVSQCPRLSSAKMD